MDSFKEISMLAKRIRYLTALVFSTVHLCTTITVNAQENNKPNFIFIITDDLGWGDLGCYGNPTVKTPHIDRLAKVGLQFENAYLTTSSCSPSRASLITGRYPHNTGAPELHDPLPGG